MAKKLLATFLAALMLLGVFTVAATANSPAHSPTLSVAEVEAFLANWNGFENFMAENAPQYWLGTPDGDRVPRSVTNRIEHYMDLTLAAPFFTQQLIVNAIDSWLFSMIFINPPSTQLANNIRHNSLANTMSRILFNHGQINFFSALWSWFTGQFWWIWLPALATVGVGAWFFMG